jgi:hypothetical protein
MSASRRKQLNIRSDEARALAHALAAETGLTVTAVIERALRDWRDGRSGRRIASTRVTASEADRNREALMAAIGLADALPPPPPRPALPSPATQRHDRD